MIETTYITIDSAAKALETDTTTLLIAAVEGRLQIYGFLGQSYEATYMVPITPQPQFFSLALKGKDSERKWFDFAPVSRQNASDLLRGIETKFEELSEVNPSDGGRWHLCENYYEDESEEIVDYVISSLIINPDKLFVKREDVWKIIALKELPQQNTIPIPTPSASRAYNTQHAIIGGLLDLILNGTDENDNKITNYKC